MRAWKDLVLKWLNCFAIEPILNINDVKERNFIANVDATSSQNDVDPFPYLLKYLNNHYPNYGAILSNSGDSCWSEEEELYLVSTLLLLHASLYHPSASFQQKAAENLSSAEQELIVAFLQSAMHHNKNLTRKTLIECIPSEDLSSSQPTTPTTGQLNKRRSRGTPLADFLSSPISRQSRKTENFRDRMSQLEFDLEQEQAEKISLLEQMQRKDAQIQELGRKYKEKSDEVKSLQDEIQQALEGHDTHKGNEIEERRKLRQELANSEIYVSKLEEEIGAMKSSQDYLQQKLVTSEDRNSEWESVVRATREELDVVKSQMLQKSEENVELSLRCNQLERDLNQIQSSRFLSPRRTGLDSPNRRFSGISPCTAPENLGFIVERQMIDIENENEQLKSDIADLEEELGNLKTAYTELSDKYERDNDAASRSLRKSEMKFEALLKDYDATSVELLECKRKVEELNARVADTSAENHNLSSQLQDVSSKKSALTSELKGLQDTKHALEIKAAQLDAKLQLSLEREEELHEIAKQRVTELGCMKQEMDDMEVKLKASLKEQKMTEQQLHDTLRKLNQTKNVEIERNDLEEQVLALKLNNSNYEKQLQSVTASAKELEEKLFILSEEKRSVESQLKDVLLKKDDLASLLDQVTAEKANLVNENLTLQTVKVRWESELHEAQSRIQDAKIQFSKEEAEKKSIQNKLAEAMATNDVLSSKLSILSQQESDLSDNLRDVLKQKRSVENQYFSLCEEKERLEAVLQETSTQLTRVCYEKESISNALATKTTELEEETLKLSNLVNDTLAFETKLASENAEKEKLRSQLTEVELKLELSQSELANVKSELELLHQQCEEKACALQDIETEKADIEDDLCHYVGRLNLATEENLSLRSDISVLKEENEKLSITCEELTKIKCDLQEKIGVMEAEQMSMSHDMIALRAELKTLSEERDEIISELRNAKQRVTNLETDKIAAKNTNSDLQQKVSTQSLRIEVLVGEIENMKENFSVKHKSLQDEIDEKAQKLSILKGEISEMLINFETLQEEKKKLKQDYQLLVNKNSKLEEDVTTCISQIDVLTQENTKLSSSLGSLLSEKDDALSWVETVEKEKKSLLSQLEAEKNLNIEILSNLKEQTALLTQLQASDESKEKLITDCQEKLCTLKEEKDKVYQELEVVIAEKDELASCCEQLRTEISEREAQVSNLKEQMAILTHLQASDESKEKLITDCKEKLCALKEEKDKVCRELEVVIAEKDELASCYEQLRTEISEKEAQLQVVQDEMMLKTQSLQNKLAKHSEDNVLLKEEIAVMDATVQELKKKLESPVDAQAQRKLAEVIALKDVAEEQLNAAQQLIHEHEESLNKALEEREFLNSQINSLQKTTTEKNEALCELQQSVETLKEEVDKLHKIISEKDQIIVSKDATLMSSRNKSDAEDEVRESNSVQLLKEDLQAAQLTSDRLSQELICVQKNLKEEKVKLKKALEGAFSDVKDNEEKADELQKQPFSAHSGGKLVELQQEETLWQLDRVKNQLTFRFDSIITQKTDLEEHLSQLRMVLEDVGRMCDTLFSALPTNCNAVHEVTIMRKEVETKLRAVDKKYADSLCGIITLAHEVFKWTRKQTDIALDKSGSTCLEHLLLSERDSIEARLDMLGEVMLSLTCDVRSVINSCKFLSERCESYLKAQTRESLKIKASAAKDGVRDIPTENCSQNNQTGESRLSHSSDSVKTSEQVDWKSDMNLQFEKEVSVDGNGVWFGGAATLSEGYSLMKRSYAELEKQITDLHAQLKKHQLSTSQRPQGDEEQKVAKLQEKISALMLRPTHEQLDEKLKELHGQYSLKLEAMKEKMKQIVKDEVDKVEDAKTRSEKEIVAKYSKRISEFEEHVQELSAQLWELGEKLLQEQQDHKTAKERLAAMKERQRLFLMSKTRTQSLDRLDLLLQESDNARSSKRRHLSQTIQTGTWTSTSTSNLHPHSDLSDVVDEAASKRSTMMAPASMGLAFPEEDEDGEVFNNDYLAELKEGRCRAPLDGSRLSELQYRNSLCPPHLKSSYPLETQFHDPQMYKDEELKGPDGRPRRPGKDRGTTSYKKPGPPTPSKKAGRLSLQGKEDLTPRVALREHNESQASQGSGMLRVAKTTPSRLKALFTSSKVANAATLPTKKDENATPGTPTSKRLSIFRRRFGSNKENQNASSGYSSFR